MAHGPLNTKMSGEFRERDFKQYFTYSEALEGEFIPWPAYPQKIWIQPDHFLWGKVAKTVAYLATDENADGTPYIDKWYINRHYEHVGA